MIDRKLVRQKFFGKKLLAGIGVSTLQFDTKFVPKVDSLAGHMPVAPLP